MSATLRHTGAGNMPCPTTRSDAPNVDMNRPSCPNRFSQDLQGLVQVRLSTTGVAQAAVLTTKSKPHGVAVTMRMPRKRMAAEIAREMPISLDEAEEVIECAVTSAKKALLANNVNSRCIVQVGSDEFDFTLKGSCLRLNL